MNNKLRTMLVKLAVALMLVQVLGETPLLQATEVEAASVEYVTTDNLNLRAGASTKTSILTTIPKGKRVRYISQSGSWFKVAYGNRTGFVSSVYLRKVAVSVVEYQTTDNLNMRTGASTKHRILITIPRGERVKFISSYGIWYKVSYKNRTGFVSSAFLKKPGTAPGQVADPKPATMMNVPVIRQRPMLPSGCEAVALTMALNYYGVRVDMRTIARQMPYDKTALIRNKDWSIRVWGDPEVGYVGNPFGTGFTINPNPLKRVADKYRKGNLALYGKDFRVIEDYVRKRKPTLVWFTINYQMPKNRTWKTSKGKTIYAPRPLHCIVVTGVDNNYVYFNDSESGGKNVKVAKSQFIKVYNAMGRRALVVN
ncbi:SH3 domain-containing protein [Bacillus massilinigeriensis]|uniref:SH3 domain-containing protein n=1 Tax=Bacillus mediterraneensis TaxID=1805474 RepID=UPI0009F4FD1E|nr:SH3 domain-containing protein [Bacillus mediterraneensis]